MKTFDGHLKDLRSLCTIIECGGITRAAELLGESKGSVSRRVTRLEDQLGVKLLNRSSRAISATEAGMTFYHRSLQALAVLDEGATELLNTHQVPSGLLRITMPVDIGLSIFPPLISDFLDLYPEIRIDVLLSNQILDLKTHQIDIALRVAQVLPDADYLFHRLGSITAQLFASPQYLAQWGTPQHPNDLNQHTMLYHQRYPGNKTLSLERDRQRFQVQLQPRIIANDFSYLQQMAIAGAGIVFGPNFLGKTDRLVRVLAEWSLSEPAGLFLLYEGWRLLPARVICFRDFIRDRLTEMA